MDILLLVILLAILVLPSFFMMRKQRQRQREVAELQAGIEPGDRVVTAAGLHGVVVGVEDDQLAIEIAEGVVTTWERIAVVRKIEQRNAGAVGVPADDAAAPNADVDADAAEARPVDGAREADGGLADGAARAVRPDSAASGAGLPEDPDNPAPQR